VVVAEFEGEFHPNLVVSHERLDDANESAEALARDVLPELRAGLDGCILLREEPAHTGQLDGFLREHSFEGWAVLLQQMQLYVAEWNRIYIHVFGHRPTLCG
jgi:hypothetical protein